MRSLIVACWSMRARSSSLTPSDHPSLMLCKTHSELSLITQHPLQCEHLLLACSFIHSVTKPSLVPQTFTVLLAGGKSMNKSLLSSREG